MRLVANQPEDLSAALLQDLALLLNGRRVDEILGVADALARFARGAEDAVATGHRFAQHGLFREDVAAEIGGALRPVVTRKRFLHDDVLAPGKGSHCQRFVRRTRGAQIDDIHRLAQFVACDLEVTPTTSSGTP